MTVKELIKLLQSFSNDEKVFILKNGDSPFFDEQVSLKEAYQIIGHSTCSGVYLEGWDE